MDISVLNMDNPVLFGEFTVFSMSYTHIILYIIIAQTDDTFQYHNCGHFSFFDRFMIHFSGKKGKFVSFDIICAHQIYKHFFVK